MKIRFIHWLASTLLACRCLAADLTKVRFVTDWYPQPEHGGYYHALENGYYKAEGLDVQITPGGPNVFAVQRIATGAAEIGMLNTDGVLLANDQGIPVVAICATFQHDPQGLMLHAGDPVRHWPDLEGRSIAMTPGVAWFPFIAKKFHLTRVREVPLTFSVAAFLKDPTFIQQIFVTSEPFFVRQAGVEPRVMLLSDAGFDPYRVSFTSQKMLREHPEIVRGFVSASLRGWRDYLANPASAHERIRKLNPELTPERMDFSYRALRDGHFIEGDAKKGEGIGGFLASRWQFQYDILKEVGVIRGNFPLTNVWTGTYCNLKPQP